MINRILSELEGAANGQPRTPGSSDREDANPLAGTVAKQAKQLQKHAEQLITAHPVAALSIAVVAGLAVGWWVKRK
jgi:ElaB/YqjD/DUF883 family membrane-anchored ribosome-binding protein